MSRKHSILALLLTVVVGSPVVTADERQPVDMPAPMQQHMLSNMRDHLRALHEIQSALAAQKFDRAAEVAEQRLGMSSLQSHGAAHMAPLMPKEMQAIGNEMHRAASRFAVTVVEGDVSRSLKDLSQITQQCVACHAAYRLR
jgi:cytochrome c556